jgi:hypothetical protein
VTEDGSFAEPAWLPAALAVIASGVLLLSRGLKQRAPELAAGPMWIAHGSVPLAVAWSSYGIADPTMSPWILAATLWAAAGFYALAAWQQQFPLWAWFAAALAPLGLLASLAAADAAPLWWALAPALLALIYLGLGVSLEPHARRYSMPAYMGMAGLALLALAYGMSLETARLALPLLIALGAGVTLSLHRRRLAWLGEQWRLAVATSGLVFAAGLTPFWAWALLALTRLTSAESSLALLPLAAVLFATARWWPGRLRRPYDLALQVIGALTAIGAGVGTLVRPSSTTALLGMAALTLVWAFQTVLRRRSLWAALALGTAPVAAALALDRLAPEAPGAYWYALGLLFAGAYGVGGTLLRRSSWRCLTWPGLVWGALTGLGLLLAVAFEIREGALFARHVLVFAALAGLLTLTAALWRRAWPGYGVAALLAADVLLAARGGWLFGWQPAQADFGYILCGVTLGLVLIGQVLRWLDQNQEPRTRMKPLDLPTFPSLLSRFSIPMPCPTNWWALRCCWPRRCRPGAMRSMLA